MASSIKNSLLMCIFLLASSTIATTSSQLPSPVKCIHHHASLITCANYLEDNNGVSPLPTEACCKNYAEIFRSGTPTCMCRYLHPEKLKTSFNVTKLMSLHELCQSPDTVPLYDLCASDGKFEGIVEIVDGDLVNHPRWINSPKQD